MAIISDKATINAALWKDFFSLRNSAERIMPFGICGCDDGGYVYLKASS